MVTALEVESAWTPFLSFYSPPFLAERFRKLLPLSVPQFPVCGMEIVTVTPSCAFVETKLTGAYQTDDLLVQKQYMHYWVLTKALHN